MSEEIKKLLGGRAVQQVKSQDLNPPKPARPQRPGSEQAKPGQAPARKGIPAPLPIIPDDQLHNYTEAGPRQPEETFGNDQSGKFDAELNEVALKELAAEQGITVEELLQRPGRKLEQKIEPAMSTPNETTVDLGAMKAILDAQAKATPAPAPAPAPAIDAAPKSGIDLELEELELKKRELELRKRQAEEAAAKAAAAIPKSKKMVRNPIMEKMREKLSLDRLHPAEVELEGIKFGLLPPPTAIHPWILGKLALSEQAGEEAMIFTLKICTACASLVTVEGQAVAEVLGLAEEGSVKNPHFPPLDLRLLTVQTLFEMFEGDPSIADPNIDLFRFSPDAAIKLYQAFTQKFNDLSIRSSLDQDLFLYVCPVPECKEEHQDLRHDLQVFCRQHGVPLEMRGKKAEVMSIPLR